MRNLIVVVLIFFTGCGDQFLDLKPESIADVSDIYQTETDFVQAVIGVYDELQSNGQYGRNLHFFFETRADIIGESSAGFQDGIYFEIDRFLMRSENQLLQQSWASLYSAVNRANMVLDRLAVSGLSAAFRNEIAAEARFLRALCYYNIVRIWGDAPLVTSVISPDEALRVTRNTKTEIYNFLITDLNQVVQHLPAQYPSSDAGRATRYSAYHLLGKVLLDQQAYPEAVQALRQIVDAQIHSLQNNFNDIFTIQNKMNSEIIFAVRYRRQLDQASLFLGRATQPITVDEDFLASYASNDLRRVASSLGSVGAYTVPQKFADPAGTDGRTGMDYPVMRYAETLLLYAEALNGVNFQANGDALNALNIVRTRAGLPALDGSTLINQEQFRAAILEERRKELIYEGHAWPDLLRLGNPIEVMANRGITINEDKFVFPIPQSELDRINSPRFQQNRGY